jgi:maleylpyruvate isomerase
MPDDVEKTKRRAEEHAGRTEPGVDLAGGLADDAGYERALAVLADVTDRLLDTVKSLDDDAVRASSLCEGWTRGHVLTHLARNADGFCNLVTWARTGAETPMYASREARNADIEAGAGRSAAELEADVDASAERLLAAIADLPVERRHVQVRSGSGQLAPAHDMIWWRLREVAYHHVDLDTGYRFHDLPAAALRRGLDEAVERLAANDGPPLRLVATDLGWEHGSPEVGLEVRGTAGDLLGWLTGRADGSPLHASGPLPRLPGWDQTAG